MTLQDLTILTCNGCQSEAEQRFPTFGGDDIDAWMTDHGWETVGGRHLCPVCLMNVDARRPRLIRSGA